MISDFKNEAELNLNLKMRISSKGKKTGPNGVMEIRIPVSTQKFGFFNSISNLH